MHIGLRDVNLSYMTFLLASFRMFGFEYFRSTLPVLFQPEMRAENELTFLNRGMKAGHQALITSAEILFHDARFDPRGYNSCKRSTSWYVLSSLS